MPKKIKKSDEIIAFLRTLKLSSAEWYGKPFEPLPWFKEVIKGIYDDVNDKGLRNIREAYISVPRKNAKSMSIAGLALYHALLDGEEDGQIYIVATDTTNASVVFDMLESMIGQNKILSKLAEIRAYKKEIVFPKTKYTSKSKIKAMSSDDSNKHGLSPSLVIYDELHTAKNRELYDVMQTGMGARRQPLMIAITTAGFNIHSFCYEQYQYAKNVKAGIIQDPHFYSYIREIEKDEDWTDPKNWEKANPSWNITVKPEYIQAQYEKARNQISAENSFRRLHCNQWQDQADRWLSMIEWQACETDIDVAGLPCWCGLDLSTNEDMTAFVQVFKVEDKFIIKPHFFLPEDTVEHHPNSRYYKEWSKLGYLNLIYGNIISHTWVFEYIQKLHKENKIQAIAYDPFMSSQILELLQGDGFNTIQYNQSFRTLSPASKDFERGIKERTILHLYNPVLDWNANNVTYKEDPQENIKPVKPDDKYAKIDGIIGAIMGCDLARRMKSNECVYKNKDFLIL